MVKEWFRSWFDENYLMVYQHRDEAEAELHADLIITTLSMSPKQRILDLACGSGRYVWYFTKKGYFIKGIDLSETMISAGRKKHPGLPIFIDDMRSFKGCYDIILSLFTSFGYFDHNANRELIERIASALPPGGHFWLDYLNASEIKTTGGQEVKRVINKDIIVLEKKDIVNKRIIKKIRIIHNNREYQYEESVALYTLEELTDLLGHAGFKINHLFGDYSGKAWQKYSTRTILAAQKNGK